MRLNLDKLALAALVGVWTVLVLYVYHTQIHVFEAPMGFTDRPIA